MNQIGDGSIMIHTRSKNEEQSNEAYSINETESTTEKEEQKLKATAKQSQTETCKQQTLHVLSRASMDTLGSIEGTNGISTHGTSYHGPRDLLSNIRRLQEAELKVTHSTATTHQGWAEIDDQQTLRTCARTSLDSLEDSKDRNEIFTLGSIYHDSRILLPAIGRTQEEWTKVAQSAAVS